MGRWGDGEMGRWEVWEVWEVWGDGEIFMKGNYRYIISYLFYYNVPDSRFPIPDSQF
ncbi:MAG: hypothetical protein F6K26_37900 [Moorea sp. SIO2I5]|nr:hypothetical protein [Moorena sp. SIO2I5]